MFDSGSGALVVITYTDGLLIQQFFSVIALLTGAQGELRPVFSILLSIGSLIAVLSAAFSGKLAHFGRIASMVLVVWLMVFPRIEVQIIDRTDASRSGTVNDMPLGLALPAAILSQLMDGMTQALEGALMPVGGVSLLDVRSDPPEAVRYSNSGAMYPSRTIERVRHAASRLDPVFRANLAEFASYCVLRGIRVGWIQLEQLVEGPHPWEQALNPANFGNALTMFWQQPASAGGRREIVGCRDARQMLETGWPASQNRLLLFLSGGAESAVAAEAIIRMPPLIAASYAYMGRVSSTAAQILQTAVVARAIEDGLLEHGGESKALTSFAVAKAEVQQKRTYQTLGRLAARTLPIIHTTLEGLVYLLFPLFIGVVMLSFYPSKTLFYYLKYVAWVMLWPPVFAVISYIGNQAAALSLQNLTLNGLGDSHQLSLRALEAMGREAISVNDLAGYLLFSAPLIAWSVVSGGQFALTSLASSLGSVAQSSGGAAGQEAASGNVRAGNVELSNRRWMQEMVRPSHVSGGYDLDTGGGFARGFRPEALGAGGTQGGSIERAERGDAGISLDWRQLATSSVQSQLQKTSENLNRVSNQLDQALNRSSSSAQRMLEAYSSDSSFSSALSSQQRQALGDFYGLVQAEQSRLGSEGSSGMEQALKSIQSRYSSMEAGARLGVGSSGIGAGLGGRAGIEDRTSSEEGSRAGERFYDSREHSRGSDFRQTYESGQSAMAEIASREGWSSRRDGSVEDAQTLASVQSLSRAQESLTAEKEALSQLLQQTQAWGTGLQVDLGNAFAADLRGRGLGDLLSGVASGNLQSIAAVRGLAENWLSENGTKFAKPELSVPEPTNQLPETQPPPQGQVAGIGGFRASSPAAPGASGDEIHSAVEAGREQVQEALSKTGELGEALVESHPKGDSRSHLPLPRTDGD